MDNTKTPRGRATTTNRSDTTTRRNPDRERERELQRLKSLGVVSVMNKTFDMQGGSHISASAPIPSPSSSTSSSAPSTERTTLLRPASSKADLYQDASTSGKLSQQQQYDTLSVSNNDDTILGIQQISQQNQNWVVAALPAEYVEPRPFHSVIHYDQNGNLLPLSEIGTSADFLRDTCHDDDDNPDDTQLYNPEQHDALVEQHKHTKQLLQQARQRLTAYHTSQQYMELSTKQSMEIWMQQKEMESIKVRQLSEIVVKQDRMIHELETAVLSVLSDNERLRRGNPKGDNDDTETSESAAAIARQEMVTLRQELKELEAHKCGYEQRIELLLSELAASHASTKALSDHLDQVNEQCQQQQLQIDEKLESLTRQLIDKELVIRKYRDSYNIGLSHGRNAHRLSTQQQLQHRRDSQRVDNSSTINSAPSTTSSATSIPGDQVNNRARYSSASLNSRRSARRNSKQLRSRNTMPQGKEKVCLGVLPWPNGYLPPPAGPPPSAPLPPLPISDDDQVDPELKLMTKSSSSISTAAEDNQPKEDDASAVSITYSHDEPDNVISPSLEMLLLQAPSGYTLNDDLTMDETYREFAEQLQSRLSISKEIDHLELWDHEALEKLQRQHQQQTARRTSLAPTTHTATSSQWSTTSGLDSDLDDHHHHHGGRDTSAAFWKGMKKKLRV